MSVDSPKAKMVYSSYKRQRILYLHFLGYRAPTIAKLLRGEKMNGSRRGIHKFIRKLKETGSIRRRPGSGRPTKIVGEIKTFVEQQMRLDDETTATQLHALLKKRGYPGA